jgi:hypothetical protein
MSPPPTPSTMTSISRAVGIGVDEWIEFDTAEMEAEANKQ